MRTKFYNVPKEDRTEVRSRANKVWEEILRTKPTYHATDKGSFFLVIFDGFPGRFHLRVAPGKVFAVFVYSDDGNVVTLHVKDEYVMDIMRKLIPE